MKILKISLLFSIIIICLTSCDQMLLYMFPEFDSNNVTGLNATYGKKISVKITVPSTYCASSDSCAKGSGVQGQIRMAIVKWYIDSSGLYVITTAAGDLDYDEYVSPVWVDIAPPTGYLGKGNVGTYTLETTSLPVDNYAVIVYDDENQNKRVESSEPAIFVQSKSGTSHSAYEFDLVTLRDSISTMHSLEVQMKDLENDSGGLSFKDWSSFQ